MKNNHPLSIWLACNFILSQNHLQYTHIISSYAKCRRRAPAESIWMDRWSFLSFISFTFSFCLSTSPRLMGLTPFNNNFRNKFPFSATVKPFWNSHIFHLRSFVCTFRYLLQPFNRRVMNRDEYKTKTYRASSSHLPFHIISISIKNNNCASSECPRVCVCSTSAFRAHAWEYFLNAESNWNNAAHLLYQSFRIQYYSIFQPVYFFSVYFLQRISQFNRMEKWWRWNKNVIQFWVEIFVMPRNNDNNNKKDGCHPFETWTKIFYFRRL